MTRAPLAGRSRALLSVLLIVTVASSASGADGRKGAGKPLRYKTPEGVAFDVTADGLSSVRFKGRDGSDIIYELR